MIMRFNNKTYDYGNWKFHKNDFEITKREVIVSISIIAILLMIGLVISNKIVEYQTDKNEIYNKAVKIESSEMFQYGMNTNVGNAFVYGELNAVDTVSYPEIGGSYMYVKKIEEHYNRHTKTETYTDSNGNTHTRTNVYYTWDYAGEESVRCKEIKFCDIKFDSYKISLPSTFYIDTIKKSSRVRYQYYGASTSYKGTVFTDLRNNTISNNSPFYTNMNINDTLEYITTSQTTTLIAFWIVWIIGIGVIVFLFYKAENKWLE